MSDFNVIYHNNIDTCIRILLFILGFAEQETHLVTEYIQYMYCVPSRIL